MDSIAAHIAPHDGVLVGQVDRAFSPDRAAGKVLEPRTSGDELLEPIVENDPGDRLACHGRTDATRSADGRKGGAAGRRGWAAMGRGPAGRDWPRAAGSAGGPPGRPPHPRAPGPSAPRA